MASGDTTGSSHRLLSHTGKQLDGKVHSSSTTPLTLLCVVRKQLLVHCVTDKVCAAEWQLTDTPLRKHRWDRNKCTGTKQSAPESHVTRTRWPPYCGPGTRSRSSPPLLSFPCASLAVHLAIFSKYTFDSSVTRAVSGRWNSVHAHKWGPGSGWVQLHFAFSTACVKSCILAMPFASFPYSVVQVPVPFLLSLYVLFYLVCKFTK